MKKVLSFILLLVLLTILSGDFLLGEKLELLTPNRVEIDNIKAGDTIFYEIAIKNGSENPLEIYKVKSSCKCTILNFEPQIIQPEKELIIQIAIDTRGMKGWTTRSVTIYSNDKKKPKTPVFFKMNVIPELDITPSFIDFQECVVGDVYTFNIILKNNLQNNIIVEKIESDLQELFFDYKEKEIKPKETISVKVIYKPVKAISNYKIVYIHIQGTEQPLYKLPVYIRVRKNEQ
ncbi:MAG: DUF1573 domain-containing protein [Calditrichia bacterium]|nr:DUF1573 domain-containing protein [Calditrichia bacterium]